MIRRICLGLVAAALIGAAAPQAATLVGKGKPATPSTIRLNESDPHLGGVVTFAATYPSSVKAPRVAVRCYQNDVLGYAEAGPLGQAFTLGGGASQWLTAGGPASCSAELFYFVWNGNNPQQVFTLATTTFNAAG